MPIGPNKGQSRLLPPLSCALAKELLTAPIHTNLHPEPHADL